MGEWSCDQWEAQWQQSCTITAISYGRQIEKEFRKGMQRGNVERECQMGASHMGRCSCDWWEQSNEEEEMQVEGRDGLKKEWALLSFGGLSPKLGIYPQFRDTISSSGIYQFPSQSIPMVSLYRGQSKMLKLAILIFQIKYQIIIITISFLVQMYAYVIKDEQIGNQNISYTNVRAILTLLVQQ